MRITIEVDPPTHPGPAFHKLRPPPPAPAPDGDDEEGEESDESVEDAPPKKKSAGKMPPPFVKSMRNKRAKKAKGK